MKPHEVGFGQVAKNAVFVFPERHPHSHQFNQHLRIYRGGSIFWIDLFYIPELTNLIAEILPLHAFAVLSKRTLSPDYITDK